MYWKDSAGGTTVVEYSGTCNTTYTSDANEPTLLVYLCCDLRNGRVSLLHHIRLRLRSICLCILRSLIIRRLSWPDARSAVASESELKVVSAADPRIMNYIISASASDDDVRPHDCVRPWRWRRRRTTYWPKVSPNCEGALCMPFPIDHAVLSGAATGKCFPYHRD